MSEFVDKAHALMQVLDPRLAPVDQPHGWTMEQAVARVSEPAWAKTDWRETAVYLTIQLLAVKSRAGDAERLALMRIQRVLDDLAEGRARAAEFALQAELGEPVLAVSGD